MSNFGTFNRRNEFVFTNVETPKPMMQYMWNSRIVSGVNQTGGGDGAVGGHALCYADPEDRGRCFVLRGGNRYFYIRDLDDGTFFNPGWYPSKTPVEGYRCRFGPGFCVIESRHGGVEARLRGFVGERFPCEIWRLALTNSSRLEKRLRTFSFADFALDGYPAVSDYFSYVHGEYVAGSHMVFCHNDAAERPHGWYHGFIASDLAPSGFDSSREHFLGVYGGIGRPEAVAEGRCHASAAACELMAGVLEHTFSVAPGQTVRLAVAIGCADGVDTAARTVRELLRTPGAVKREYSRMKAAKAETAKRIAVKTPDWKVDAFANCWLKEQVQFCAEMGRDGCKGFRDQLQDAWAIAAFRPELARGKILEALRYEYASGMCERAWLPVRHQIYSDASVWISPCVNAYLKETGSADILGETVPYFDGPQDTVLGHMLAALRFSSEDTGVHGLVHARGGDWNDSLNRIGIGGKGESVWTSIGLYYALGEMEEIAVEVLEDRALAAEMRGRAKTIGTAVNRFGWDGGWYLAAYNDLGEKVGTHTEQTGKIYLNPQTWAVFSGLAGDRAPQCLEAVDTLLESPYGPLTLYPPYTAYNGNIGRLTGFVPGIWENGAPYCHGGAFKIVADCVSGRGDRAYRSLLQILPDSAENPSDHSGCEPYALTNMYLGPDNPRAGKVLYAWMTGSAGWIFRAVTQYMLGFTPGYRTVEIRPCIPAAWKTCSIERAFRGDVYRVTIENPAGKQSGVRELLLDGAPQKDDCFPICGDGKLHEITARL